MPTINGRRPSPAMLVAFLALVVALDGPAYAIHAARSIAHGSKKVAKRDARKMLKAHTVTAGLLKQGLPGTILAANTLTGAQIAEGSLGKVPAAGQADHATAADAAKRADTAGAADAAKVADTAKVADAVAGAGTRTIPIAPNTIGVLFDDGVVRIDANCMNGTSVNVNAVNTSAAPITVAWLRDSTGSLTGTGSAQVPPGANTLLMSKTGLLASTFLGQGYMFSATDQAGKVRVSFDLGISLGAVNPTSNCVAFLRVDA
jgi:hypothetical protein